MAKFSLKDFFGDAISKVVSAIGDAIDKNVTSKQEKLAAQKEITEILLTYQTELDSEVTERLRIDMQSDNKLSKIIRPLTLIFTTIVVSLLAVSDGNILSFTVNESYISLFQSLMLLQYGFYFGSRGMEKIAKNINVSVNNKK